MLVLFTLVLLLHGDCGLGGRAQRPDPDRSSAKSRLPPATQRKPKRRQFSICPAEPQHAGPFAVSQRVVSAQGVFLDARSFEDLERMMPARLHLVSIQPVTSCRTISWKSNWWWRANRGSWRY